MEDRVNGLLFNELTAHRLILNMFALKHSSWIDLILELTPKRKRFYKINDGQLCDRQI